MKVDHRYAGQSGARTGTHRSLLSFSPDISRQPTWFRGTVAQPWMFRDGMAALFAVVSSDLRPRSKDRSAYLAWRHQQDDIEWAATLAALPTKRVESLAALKDVKQKLNAIQQVRNARQGSFLRAQRAYFDWLYTHDRGAWVVLDPIITVHPDQLFFECFSADESSYARFTCQYGSFRSISDFSCGTTNIDFSRDLSRAFEKLRSYRDTELLIDPSGFSVHTHGEVPHYEKKIDVPDSWVRGFLQVSAAMGLPGVSLRLHPIDLHNLLFVLRRRIEQHGPRSLRFCIQPDGAIHVEVEPFAHHLVLARSNVIGSLPAEPLEVRVWGRRRLRVLERLLPHARHIDVRLLGSGLPSFWNVLLPGMTFTLGLSGWTANDWSRQGAFDLMAPRGNTDARTISRVTEALTRRSFATVPQLVAELNDDSATITEALFGSIQAGQVMLDADQQTYRARPLFRDPLDRDAFRWASPREAEAQALIQKNAVLVFHATPQGNGTALNGTLFDARVQRHATALLDQDDRMVTGTCTCAYFRQNKLHYGPCSHILALRIVQSQQHGKARP